MTDTDDEPDSGENGEKAMESELLDKALTAMVNLTRTGSTDRPIEKAIRAPEFDGTTAADWSKPPLGEILSEMDIADPDTEWSDLSRDQKERVASLHLEVVDLSSDRFEDAVRFPAVEPSSRNLNRSALENAKARARFASDPDRLRSLADRLLEENFEVEKAEHEVRRDEDRCSSGEPFALFAPDGAFIDCFSTREDADDFHAQVSKQEVAVDVHGPKGARWMFVGASPSKIDRVRDKHLTGAVGEAFRAHYLDPYGLSKSDVALGTLVPEVLTHENGAERTPSEAEIQWWSDWLWKRINEVEPKRLVALGRVAKEALEGVYDIWLPHPYAVAKHGASDEMKRKMLAAIKADTVPVALRKEALPVPELPVAPDRPFEKTKAVQRVREWASSDGSGDKPKIDFAKYARAFLARTGKPTNLSAYRLIIADVIDGELQIVPAAVRRAKRRLPSTDLSGERAQVRQNVNELLERVREDTVRLKGELFKARDEQQVAWYEVYIPDEVDAHGEFARGETIERAAYRYLEDYGYVGKHHEELEEGARVVASAPLPGKMTMDDGTELKKNTWIAAIRWPDEAWEEVRNGETPGISMGGMARRRVT